MFKQCLNQKQGFFNNKIVLSIIQKELITMSLKYFINFLNFKRNSSFKKFFLIFFSYILKVYQKPKC